MNVTRQRLDEIIREFADKNPGKGRLEIAEDIRLAYNTGYSNKYVADLISQYRGTAINYLESRKKRSQEKYVPPRGKTIRVIPDKDIDKYVVEDGTYRWKAKRGPMELTVEKADQMFYEYSRHGLDMSQSQMRQKHGLKIWQWNSIKNTLFLYKDANIMSPHTEDTTPENQLQDMIDQKMNMKFQDKQRLVETSYNKETIKRYKQVIDKDQRATFALENMIDELDDITSEWKNKTAVIRRTEDFKTERKWLVVTLADLHIGARVENLNLTPKYDPKTVRETLDAVARRINAAKPTDVTLAFLGDLIESFTGLNHKNSWQSIEYGMIGARVIKEAMSILEEFIAKVDNVRQVLGVAGNHDRVTSDNKEDRKGQVADIIFYMLQRLYGKEIQIDYQDLVLSVPIDGIQYILTHTDKRTIRDGKQAVIDYGDSKLFNLILGGHTHSRRTVEDERSFRWVIAPSIFSGNFYSEENAWFAKPGFLTFENDGSGKPIMTDHTL